MEPTLGLQAYVRVAAVSSQKASRFRIQKDFLKGCVIVAVLPRARAVVIDIARGYLALPDDWSRRLWLGDDFRNKLDKLAVMVAAHDYAIASSRDRGVAALAALPQFPLLPAPVVDAPPLALVLELRFFAYQLDIDSLDDDDANDLQQERDWCDFWYGFYARQLDAS